MAEIAEIEEISDFDKLMERALAEIDNVDKGLNDWQDPIKRQPIVIYTYFAKMRDLWFSTSILIPSKYGLL